MITPIKEILEQIVGYNVLNENSTQVQIDDYNLLKRWGESIVQECAGSFECEMAGEICTNGIGMEFDDTYPVLVRSSINDVIKQII